MLRLTAALLTFASRWWQLETLYRSNVKYRPRWDPRFICFQTGFAVNRGVIAAGVAEGFIPGPAPVGHRLRADDELAAAVRAIDAAPPVWTALTHTPRGQALVRHRKLEVLAANGVAAYPVSVPRTTSVADVRKHHHGLDPGAATGEVVSVVGRIVRLRDHGGVRFAVIREDGADVQVMLARDVLGAAAADLWGATVDRGDHVSVTGEVVTSRTGELSVQATAWTMASKCLGTDRNLELTLDPAGQQALHARGSVLAALRGELVGRGFLEVETPMLQAVHGGANARPFVTHINAYDLDLYLRIAPELFLKRLTVEWRRTGLRAQPQLPQRRRRRHPQPRVHVAGGVRGPRRLRRRCARLARSLDRSPPPIAVHGRPIARRPDGSQHDLDVEWPIVTVHDAVAAATGRTIDPSTPVEELRRGRRDSRGGRPVRRRRPASSSSGCTTLSSSRRRRRPRSSPTSRSMSRRSPDRTTMIPRLAERWDLVAFGMELGTAYSELTDPIDQRARLTAQSIGAAAGDPEAMEVDEEFLAALELGMPPTGGLGLGVDRVLMLVTGTTIRGTLAFPFVTPQARRP